MSRISDNTKKQLEVDQNEKAISVKYNTMLEVFFKAINLNKDDTYSQDEVNSLLEQVISTVEGGNIAKGTYSTLVEATTDLDPVTNFPDSNKWTINIDGTGSDKVGIYKWFLHDLSATGSWVFSSQFIELATATQDGLLSSALFNIIKDYPLFSVVDGRINTNVQAIALISEKIEGDSEELTKLADLVAQQAQSISANRSNITRNETRITVVENKVEILEDAKVINDTQVAENTKDIAEHKVITDDNTKEIVQIKAEVSGLGTDKQGIKLAYKAAQGEDVTIEDQVKDNEEENKASKLREENFLKKDDGEMAVGYNASGDKEVIVKETFDNQKSAMQKALDDINTTLAAKADVSDLGQKPLIYIPGQGVSDTAAVTPVIPSKSVNTLTYTFNSVDWTAWKTRLDPDNKLLINGIQADIYIKDNTSTTYPGKESYNNGSSTKITFGTDADAQWSLNDGNLVIVTNNQNSDTTRTVRQITFLVESTAGSSVDQGARDLIAKLQGETQKIAIDLIGITSKTVEGALTELKNRIDAVEDAIKGISYDEPSKTTSISDNLTVGETLEAKKITQGGVPVALKTEILEIIPADENNTTVKEVKDAIIATLLDQEGRKSVLFEHAEGTQKALTFVGYVEKVTVDPIEGGVAYYGESAFDKFTTIDNHEPYIYQLFLNIKGWKIWQATLATTDPRYKSDYAATTQATLDTYTIFFARREAPLKVSNENVLTDTEEDASLAALETLVNGGIDSNVIPNPAPPEEDDDFMVNEINRFGGGLDD